MKQTCVTFPNELKTGIFKSSFLKLMHLVLPEIVRFARVLNFCKSSGFGKMINLFVYMYTSMLRENLLQHCEVALGHNSFKLRNISQRNTQPFTS